MTLTISQTFDLCAREDITALGFVVRLSEADDRYPLGAPVWERQAVWPARGSATGRDGDGSGRGGPAALRRHGGRLAERARWRHRQWAQRQRQPVSAPIWMASSGNGDGVIVIVMTPPER